MISRRNFLTALLSLPLMSRGARGEDKKTDNGKIRIGFVESLFKDSSAPFSSAVVEAFAAMVRAQTGLDTEVIRGGEVYELSGRLRKDLHFGILQGVEFAWAQQKDPQLKPLILAINQNPLRRGFLVVRQDSKVKRLAELKGKSLVLPLHSRAHCELFLEKGCRESVDKGPKDFFAPFTRADNAEDALDDLVDGDVDSVLLDAVAFESYQERKPGRAAKIKIIQKSEPFPATAVAYRPGHVDGKRLQIFRDGLITAKQSILGRYLMTLWKLTAFDPVSEDYDEQLTNILKAYPPPN